MHPHTTTIAPRLHGDRDRFLATVRALADRGPVVVSFDRATNRIEVRTQPTDHADGDETDAHLGKPGASRR